MPVEVVVAIIGAIGLILAGILVELIRGRRQLNLTLSHINERLIVVETALGIRYVPRLPEFVHQQQPERRDNA